MASRDQNFSSSEDESTGEVRIHEELPRGSERDVIEHYFYKGLLYRQIVLMLEKHHNLITNQGTLRRRLKDFGLTRRETVDEELRERVKDIILQEIFTSPDSLNDYRTMWHILRLRRKINVSRRLVESLMREGDPRGVEQRKGRCLRCRMYVSPGSNFCWHIDGYDKLKPFGFSIHGCVDGCSRRIIWLEVQRSNKNPKCIAKYFLNHVKAARGCPVRVYTDPGTENGLVAGIQCYLRADGWDEYAGSKSHKYVTSTCNQRIECQWSHFRFADLQTDLDKVKDYWNSHRIRKFKHATVSGVPDMMYFLPEEFGHSDCLLPVPSAKLTEMENTIEEMEGGQDETDAVYAEYFHTSWKRMIYLLEQLSLKQGLFLRN